jgi:hypothetical protein
MIIKPTRTDPMTEAERNAVDNIMMSTFPNIKFKIVENPQWETGEDVENQSIDASSITIMPRSAISISEAQEIIKNLVNIPLTNDKIGITATISKRSIRKLGVSKDYEDNRLHAKAVANIDILFKNAEFDVTHKDYKNNDKIKSIHRLGSLMFDEITNEYIPVMITVKEFVDNNGNRIYSVESIDIEKMKSAGLPTDTQNERLIPITDFTAKMEELIETTKNSSNNARNQSIDNKLADIQDKKSRIEKLRNSESIEITGDEIPYDDDVKQYNRNALEYGKGLRGEYVNKDTGNKIFISTRGVKEVLHHEIDYIPQIQSIAAIPQIIENGIYLDTIKNEDLTKNKSIEEYQYYACGLKIGDVDYTVKFVVAVDYMGNRYYDHSLTEIEKGKLLESTSRITRPVGQKEAFQILSEFVNSDIFSGRKDIRLISILQKLFAEISQESNIQNQKNNEGRIIGQANLKAMTVLLDAIHRRDDSGLHEYAHHYIG